MYEFSDLKTNKINNTFGSPYTSVYPQSKHFKGEKNGYVSTMIMKVTYTFPYQNIHLQVKAIDTPLNTLRISLRAINHIMIIKYDPKK